jgi:hypothetical protein
MNMKAHPSKTKKNDLDSDTKVEFQRNFEAPSDQEEKVESQRDYEICKKYATDEKGYIKIRFV